MYMERMTGVQTRHSRVHPARCLPGYGGLMEKSRCTQGCRACDRRFRTCFQYVRQSSGVRHYEELKMKSASARWTRTNREYILRGVRGRRQVIPLCRIWYATRPVLKRRLAKAVYYIVKGRTIQFGGKHQDQNHRYHGRTRGRTRNP